MISVCKLMYLLFKRSKRLVIQGDDTSSSLPFLQASKSDYLQRASVRAVVSQAMEELAQNTLNINIKVKAVRLYYESCSYLCNLDDGYWNYRIPVGDFQ